MRRRPVVDATGRIGIIGAGHVGRTLARLWHEAGYDIGAVFSRTASHADELAQQVQAQAVDSAGDVVTTCDLILLTVPDDVIAPLARSLSDETWQGKAAVHCSGATELDALHPLADSGAMTGCLHPAFPFSDVETAILNLPGATFAIEARHDALRERLRDMVTALDGQVLLVPDGQKAAYHAALCIASNYTVTLYAVAEALLRDMGAESAAVSNALNRLLQATTDNLAQQGIPNALTGPLSRADTGTLQRHMDALNDTTLHQTYIHLARLTRPLLEARGLSETELGQIDRLLQDNEP